MLHWTCRSHRKPRITFLHSPRHRVTMMRFSYFSLPLLVVVYLVNAQGGVNDYCRANDGSSTGSSSGCLSGE